MTRLALSLLAAIAISGGFLNCSSANDSTTFDNDQDTDNVVSLVAFDESQGESDWVGDYSERGSDYFGSMLENTSVFAGGDVYKSVGERITNINGGVGALTASFGTVFGFNTGFGLGDSRIRGQFGASYGIYDLEGRLRIVPQATNVEEQMFVTAGVYKRGDMLNDSDPISWGVVYDVFCAEGWGVNSNTIGLGQLRGVFGYALTQSTEVGVWATLNVDSDRAAVTVAGAPGLRSTIRSMNQANLYVKQNTAFGAQITGYVGAFDNADIGDWQFGMIGQAPLSCNWSLYSNFNYVVPGSGAGPRGSGEEQFNVSAGLAYYFGGKAQSPSVTGQAGLPLLNVANNGSFLVTD